MAEQHVTIIIIFVPAGLTGLFQPCDVGFQRLFKHSLKLSAHNDTVQEVLTQLKNGIQVDDIKIDTTLKVLRDRTVDWLWVAFNKLNKLDIVKKVCFFLIVCLHFNYLVPKAWLMCRAGQFNLSYESLTSHGARQMLRDLPTTDPAFFAELSQPRSRTPVAPTLTAQQMTAEDADATDIVDESDVPLSEVMAAHHNRESEAETSSSENIYTTNETGGLTSTAGAENVYTEAVGDVIDDVTPDVPGPLRRTQRARRKNIRYQGDWWLDHGDDEEE
jgi:hypothetical protein